jgi:hypothetical protein
MHHDNTHQDQILTYEQSVSVEARQLMHWLDRLSTYFPTQSLPWDNLPDHLLVAQGGNIEGRSISPDQQGT